MKRFNVDPNSSEMIEAVTLGALMILDILEHSDRYDVIPSDNEQDKQAETIAIMAREFLKGLSDEGTVYDRSDEGQHSDTKTGTQKDERSD